jgi:hypothetical protein
MTSIKNNNPAKSLKWLYNSGAFKGKIIDYGCGQVARNAEFLRSMGLKVYSYDLYWGESGVDGWVGISKDLPNYMFDVGFTSFVLNVVNIIEEDNILQWMNSHCRKQYHITRNEDIIDMITKALERGDKTVVDFFKNRYGGDMSKKLTKADIENFAFFGTKTNKGFQRIPELQFKGYELIKLGIQDKIYEK